MSLNHQFTDRDLHPRGMTICMTLHASFSHSQGLDGSLADFTLRQCNEDLAAAASFLHECLHADNKASASADAQVLRAFLRPVTCPASPLHLSDSCVLMITFSWTAVSSCLLHTSCLLMLFSTHLALFHTGRSPGGCPKQAKQLRWRCRDSQPPASNAQWGRPISSQQQHSP